MAQFVQQLGELHTHKGLEYYPDNLAETLDYYGARIVRDLGRLHELTEGKIILASILEMSGTYAHLVNLDDIPDATPQDFYNETLLPAMEAEVTKEEIENE